MGSQTAAGSSLALSAMLPSSFDAAGYVALTYVEIGQVEKLGSFGASFAKVEFQGLKGAKQKFKGSADFGALQPSIALDALDAGQILLQTASDDETQKLYSFQVTFPDGSARYFRGRVFGAPETADGADSMLMATPTVEICSKVVKVDAGATITPSPTLTQPSISPTSGAVGTTFTATDGTVTNGTITGRRWLLGTTAIGTGTTVTPNAAGSLTRENTAVGTNGETITSTSVARTVSAATPTPTPTPTPTLTLSPTTPSIASNAAAGTLVSNISNVPASVTPSVTPNDGRLVIAGDASAGWKVVRGMSAISVGTINFSVAATGATGASGVLTVSAASVMPLRTIAVQNRMHTGSEARSTHDRQAFRWPIYIAQDASEANLWFSNWLHSQTPGPNGFPLEVLGVSLQKEGDTTTVPVLFNGARNLPMADGANDLLSDAILPSAFGLSKFTTGELYWVKGILGFAASSRVPSSQRAVSQFSGSQAAFFTAANTTPTSVDAPGAFTVTGTALDGRSNGYCPMLLGRPLVDKPSFIGLTDSIGEITGDNGVGTSADFGLAFFQRSMHDAGTARTGLRPSILVGRVGIAAFSVAASDLWKPLLKYVRFAIDELGTNDIGTSGNAVLSSIQTSLQSIWTACAAAGVGVYRTNLTARSTSTNGWLDKAGQTPSPGWGDGQTRDQLIAWFATKVSDGTLRGVIDTLSVSTDATDNHYYLSNGTGFATTVDGTHPQPFIHELMAGSVRAVIAGLS
jgi:hypothetical protein